MMKEKKKEKKKKGRGKKKEEEESSRGGEESGRERQEEKPVFKYLRESKLFFSIYYLPLFIGGKEENRSCTIGAG